jgi:hypothetical protein
MLFGNGRHQQMKQGSKIAQTLRFLMERDRVSLKELSAQASIPLSSLTALRNGSRKSLRNPEHIGRLSSFFKVTSHFILFGVEDPNSKQGLEQIIKDDMFSGIFEVTLKRVKLEKKKEEK